jgi:hypothetical protein
MTLDAWRKDAVNHHLWVLEKAGPEYAMDSADRAEKASEGVLKGLGQKVRKVIAEQRAKVAA